MTRKPNQYVLPAILLSVLIFLTINVLSIPVLAGDWAKCTSGDCVCRCDGTGCRCGTSQGSCYCECESGERKDCIDESEI